MKVLHTIEGMEARYGGIATCTFDLLSSLQGAGREVKLLTFAPKDPEASILGIGEGWIDTIVNDGVGPVNYSRNTIEALRADTSDVLHVNGLWQHICHATCVHARNTHRPYVITPHGMLYQTALKRSYWKKWPLMKLWFNKDILEASCIHVTCEEEMRNVRMFGYRGPVAIIGNPTNIPDYVDDILSERGALASDGNTKRQLLFGFLGRLHPIKRIENIIAGMALRPELPTRLAVIGSGDAAYEAFLHSEVERQGVADRVDFLGFVSGREKYEQLSRLSALFVPSDMENFGMIIPEAFLVGTPVMASLGTPWKDLNDHNCGWWTDNTPESIAKVIDDIAAKSPAKLIEMGMRGRQLVIDRYHPSKVADKMLRLYEWLLGKSPKPDFVYES